MNKPDSYLSKMKKITKSSIAGGLVGIALFLTGCPPLPDKFSVAPLISPLVLDEGLPLEAKFKVSGRSIDDLAMSAQSKDYNQIDISKFSNERIYYLTYVEK